MQPTNQLLSHHGHGACKGKAQQRQLYEAEVWSRAAPGARCWCTSKLKFTSPSKENEILYLSTVPRPPMSPKGTTACTEIRTSVQTQANMLDWTHVHTHTEACMTASVLRELMHDHTSKLAKCLLSDIKAASPAGLPWASCCEQSM